MNEVVDGFMQEIEKLKDARRILEQVFLEVGPYRDGKLTVKTWSEVRNYFGFDDSE